MQSIFWFLVWFTLFAGVSSPVIPVASVSIQEAPLGEPFTLKLGAAATVDGGKLVIAFERIVEDSRCPADVMCAWSGQAIVALQVAIGDEMQTVELGGFTDYDGVLRPQRPGLETTPSAEVGGYTIELLTVMPYPEKADAPPTAADYQVQFLVRSLNPDLQD